MGCQKPSEGFQKRAVAQGLAAKGKLTNMVLYKYQNTLTFVLEVKAEEC